MPVREVTGVDRAALGDMLEQLGAEQVRRMVEELVEDEGNVIPA